MQKPAAVETGQSCPDISAHSHGLGRRHRTGIPQDLTERPFRVQGEDKKRVAMSGSAHIIKGNYPGRSGEAAKCFEFFFCLLRVRDDLEGRMDFTCVVNSRENMNPRALLDSSEDPIARSPRIFVPNVVWGVVHVHRATKR